MFRRSAAALAAVLVLGSASMAMAEDSSSSFEGRLNAMTERAWGAYHHRMVTRGVALHHHHHRHSFHSGGSSWMNRASQLRDGGN